MTLSPQRAAHDLASAKARKDELFILSISLRIIS